MGVGAASAFATRRLMQSVWKDVKGQDPPSNPASPRTTWREALVWATISGVLLAVTRLVAAARRRGGVEGEDRELSRVAREGFLTQVS